LNRCAAKSHSKPRRECARDSVADVDPMRINVRIDNHTDVPLEQWQDRLKRERRKKRQPPGPADAPASPGNPPPDALIDEYAALPPA
jgi:hypothetical protein